MPKKNNLFTFELNEYGAGLTTWKGEDFVSAIEQIKPKGRGKSVLKVTFGGRSKEMILHPINIKRLIANKIARLLMEKRFKMALGIPLQ